MPRPSLSALVRLIVLAVLALGPTPALTAAEKRLNIVFVLTDDQARWAMGAYGNKECKTPNMDRLARDGARFLNAFVPTPVCSPSRASMITGQYGTQLGITDWITPNEGDRGIGLPANAVTWPSVLQKHGYTTGLVGKWHLGSKPHNHPTRQGLAHFVGALGGGFPNVNPTLEALGRPQRFEGHSADVIGDHAVRFLEAYHKRPFALLVHFREPHTPYTPMRDIDVAPFKKLDPTIPTFPGLDVAQIKRWTREYYACVHAADRNLGKVLAKLDELKLRDRTIVVFTSDHGYMIGHHGLHTKGNGYWVAGGVAGPKRPNMFEESIRVPLLVRWPGVVPPGTEVSQFVSNIDTFASVLGMLGVPVPKGAKHEGADFSPLLRGRRIGWRDTIYGQYDLHNGGLAYMRMVRTNEWKLVRHLRANGLDELYNLKDDPGETTNVYGRARSARVRAALEKQLAAWMKSINDPLVRDLER
jgi:uncharacterized sulfatase